jgi:hypothetical protein
MQQLLSFAIHLGIVAWLRAAVVPRPQSNRLHRWCVELGFGLLVALPHYRGLHCGLS